MQPTQTHVRAIYLATQQAIQGSIYRRGKFGYVPSLTPREVLSYVACCQNESWSSKVVALLLTKTIVQVVYLPKQRATQGNNFRGVKHGYMEPSTAESNP